MTRITLLIPLILITISSCSQKKINPNEFYSADFNWTMKIPNSFVKEAAEKWEKVQNEGKKTYDETYHIDLKKMIKTVFIFKSGNDNFFEATSEYYDKEKKGDYYTNVDKNYDYFYTAGITQRPDISIDTIKGLEIIDNLEFKKIRVKTTYPNQMVKNIIMYSRLFSSQDLHISIMYSDDEKGKLMLESLKNSKFESSIN